MMCTIQYRIIYCLFTVDTILVSTTVFFLINKIKLYHISSTVIKSLKVITLPKLYSMRREIKVRFLRKTLKSKNES